MTDSYRTNLHPIMQFVILVLLTIGFMIAGGVIGAGIIYVIYGLDPLMDLMHNGISPQVVNPLWILQITSTTIPLIAGPLVFARFVMKEPTAYLKANTPFNPNLLIIVLVVMIFSMPLMELIINLNQQMKLPYFLSGIEKWMRDSENEAAKETAILLSMKTFGQMLFALIVVGLSTAIVEEFFFRGCVQTIFTRWTNNPHWGIWIAAILFSAIHMQFFGFFPRMLLGVFFGYFVWWCGSVWTSVWGHFINNGTAVVVTYLYQHKKITMNPDDSHVFNYGLYAFSLIITVLLLVVYRKLTLTSKRLAAV